MDIQEPIAIVGLGCRFPGGDNLDEFWRVLSKGENHVIDVPPDRWNVDAWYHPEAPGKMYSRKLGAVKGHDEFDNRLYGISESESLKMDPQQRFVLDSVHMALEDGGFTREHLRGSKTGVYIGSMNTDYSNILSKHVEVADNYHLTGSANSIVAARVSYVYDLRGPAVTLDTACSSALMAIHLASQGLSTGDCDLALAGGVNLVMIHISGVYLSQAGMASRVGQCQAFSADADGYVRGEGCGVVVLKRLSDALKNKDKIWGTITTGTNQDGHMAQPITAPSGLQQEQLLEDMYSRHNIDKSTVQYIEAHGTGTPVGDPIEANCLGRFFGQDGKIRHIGSVKTNIGHLESAAGAAGLIKVLLMMKHETIVPSLFSSKLNSKIEFEKYHLKVPTDCVPWEELPSGGRAAGVNSFGFGGSNCHAYVKQYVKIDPPLPPKPRKHGYRMIAVSSKSSSGLTANVLHLKEAAERNRLDVDALSFTSTCRRDHHEYRLAFYARDQEELIAELGKHHVFEVSQPAKKLRVVYVFCGMGTAWKGMCIDLLDKEQVFRDQLEEIDELLKEFNSVSVINKLRNQSNIHDPAVEPLVLFACQVGLTAVWRTGGVEADAVIGQSVGEVAAAHAAGILSLRSAVDVIYHRTQLLLQSVGGKMLVIGKCPVEKVEELCHEQGGGVNVAVYNSPTSCTVSGDDEAVTAVRKCLKFLDQPDMIITELSVKTAYHCHKQKPLANSLIKALNGLKGQDAQLDIVSTVTGHLASSTDFKTAEYWVKNLTDPVKFYQGLLSATDGDKFNVFLEIGPRPVLRAHFNDVFSTGYSNGVVVPSMEKMSNTNTMVSSLGKLFSHGVNPRWASVIGQGVTQLTVEPKYQFQRTKGLFEPETSLLERQGLPSMNGRHPYVNRVSGNLLTMEIRINENDTAFVYSHVVGGAAFVPGSLFADVAFEYAKEIFENVVQDVRVSVRLLKPVGVMKGRSQTLTLMTEAQSSHSASFRILHKNSACVFGEVVKSGDSFEPKPCDIAAVRMRCTSSMDKDEIYDRLRQFGFAYGEQLQLITKCEANSVECLAWLSVSDLVKTQMCKTHLHPSILDAIMQSTCAIYSSTESVWEDRIPSILGEISIHRKVTGDMMCYSKQMSQSNGQFHFRVLLLTHAGQVIAELKDFVIQILSTTKTTAEDLEYELQWVPTEISTTPPDKRAILFIHRKRKPDKILHKLSDSVKVISEESTSGLVIPIDKISGVVFYADSSEETEDYLMRSLTEMYDNLREVICFLINSGSDIPVSVVTVNTQISKDGSSVSQVNLDGSHLWGMVRCYVKEDNRKLQLIDLQDFTQASIDTLTNCLNLQSFHEFRFRELMICEGKLFRYSVKTSLRVMPIREKLSSHTEVNQPLNLVSGRKTPSCPYEYRLEYSTQAADTSSKGEIIPVKVQYVVITKSSASSTDKLQTHLDEGQRLVCVEAVGTAKHGQENKDVIVFIPTFAKTVLTVSKTNTIPKSLIRDYKAGLLTCLAIIENMAQQIPLDSQVAVITEPRSRCFGQLLKAVLNYKGSTQVQIHEKLTQESIPKGTSHVILFSNCSKEFFITEETGQTIISIEGFGLESKDILLLTSLNFTLRVIKPWEMFSSGKISECLKQISTMLSMEWRRLNEILSTFEEKHLEIFVSHVIHVADQSLPLCVTERTLFRGNASYVIVGGLTGLGWLIVQFIAEMGGGLIAITSRRTPDADAQEKMRKLSLETGAKIEFLQADVCDLSSLENAFVILQTKYPDHAVKGIFQGAGVLKDSLLLYSTAEDFEKVASPKIQGSLNLHKLCMQLGLKLDYFILQSSVASVFGNPGQTSYGAANSFLDTLASYRRQKGLKAQSLNWGPLCVGMAVKDESVVNSWKSAGFEAISEEGVRQCLRHALLSDKAHVCFADIYIKVETPSADIRTVLDSAVNSPAERHLKGVDIDLSAIRSMNEEDRKQAFWKYIKALVNREFTVSSELLQLSTPLYNLGLNSMVAVSLSNCVRNDTGIHLPATRLLSEDLTMIDLVTEIENAVMANENVTIAISPLDIERMYSKLSPLISPIQAFMYQKCHRNNFRNDILIGTEFNTTFSIPKENIKAAVYKVLERNKPIRTVYRQNGNRVEPVLLEAFKVPKIIDISCDDPKDLTEQVRQVFHRPFDLSKELPLRIIYNHTNGPNSEIRFLFHHVSFDQKAVYMFFNELKSFLLSENLPAVKEVNIPSEVFKCLSPQFRQQETFWEKRINQSIHLPLLSLSTSPNAHIPPVLEKTVLLDIPTDIVADIIKMSQILKITMFQFLVSSLQLLWHMLTGEEKLSLIINIDTRQHVPALMNVMTHCVNYLPVIGSFDQDITIGGFLQSNSAEVRQCVEHGLYPGFLVLENTSEVTAANICRHNVVMEDFTEQVKLTDYSGVHLGKSGPMGLDRETRLLLWTSGKYKILQLQLDYHPDLLTQEAAQTFLSDFKAIITFSLGNLSTVINDIPTSILSSSVTSSKNVTSSSPASLMNSEPPISLRTTVESKQPISYEKLVTGEKKAEIGTANQLQISYSDITLSTVIKGFWCEMKVGDGCCTSSWEDVFLRLSLTNGKPGCLEWGLDEHGRSGRWLSPKLGESVVVLKEVKFFKLIIQSGNKTVKFRTMDESVADTWIRALTELKRSKEHPQSYVNRGAVFETNIVTTHL
ncbi:LOW QUALITY PROTEIN: mycocerosic acid synthase-like [Liolophura sinensis]|uniref:LOW QUALITY PROTEIN: mycocerosic acid synthase-like n=1 Tax=Liolophura sinensis TaxID=3198878 RepID=UPI0031584479